MSILDRPIKITYTDDSDKEFIYSEGNDVKIKLDGGKLSICSPEKKLKNVKLYYKRVRRDNALYYVD